jgi:hypothetical protein
MSREKRDISFFEGAYIECMSRTLRSMIIVATAGIIWYLSLQLFFVWSGAQQILANPQYQSNKFLAAFTQQPLPLMAEDPSIVWKGLLLVGALLAIAFLIINAYLNGSWLRRGLTFGFLHWLIMTPWFEFYLPHNVMREPLPLVLFECLLWLMVTTTLGLYMSLVINAGKQPGQ